MVYTRSNREIEKISKSCQIVADTLIMLEEHIVEGTCVSDLDSMAEKYIRSQGARPAFKGYMGFLQHYVFQSRKQLYMEFQNKIF